MMLFECAGFCGEAGGRLKINRTLRNVNQRADAARISEFGSLMPNKAVDFYSSIDYDHGGSTSRPNVQPVSDTHDNNVVEKYEYERSGLMELLSQEANQIDVSEKPMDLDKTLKNARTNKIDTSEFVDHIRDIVFKLGSKG